MEQQPVAYVTGFHNGHCVIQSIDPAVVLPAGMALYRAPTEWVGLTDEEIDAAWRSVDYTVLYEQFRIDIAHAIEAKLKEKNK